MLTHQCMAFAIGLAAWNVALGQIATGARQSQRASIEPGGSFLVGDALPPRMQPYHWESHDSAYPGGISGSIDMLFGFQQPTSTTIAGAWHANGFATVPRPRGYAEFWLDFTLESESPYALNASIAASSSSWLVRLSGGADNMLLYRLVEDRAGNVTLASGTLQSGAYQLYLYFPLEITSGTDPGEWSTSFSLTVPAPATAGLLVPVAILAWRRRKRMSGSRSPVNRPCECVPIHLQPAGLQAAGLPRSSNR